MEDLQYQYSKGNLLENPQKYQMSSFVGESFLKAYKKSRKDILKSLNTQVDILKIQRLINENFLEKDPYLIVQENFETQILFNSILKKMLNQEHVDDKLISIFVKKFEIRKRLYSKYNKKFKEVVTDYQNLKNYLLLSIICLLKFEVLGNLKFLNASLKINDLLCSELDIKRDEAENELLSFVINKELRLIEKLCKEQGLAL